MESIKNWMIDAANILFDDSKNDLRALPKTVRLQILLVLSFIWTTVFSLYVFSYTTFAFGWAGLYVAHIGLIFAVYMTFKNFHKAEEKSNSVFKTKNFDPFKIMVIVFVIVFIFVFSKGIEVLTSPNPSSYSIPYDGPSKIDLIILLYKSFEVRIPDKDIIKKNIAVLGFSISKVFKEFRYDVLREFKKKEKIIK